MNDKLQDILLAVSKSPTIDLGEIEPASKLIIKACCEGLGIGRVGIWLLVENGIKCSFLFDEGNWLDTEELLLTTEQFPNYFAALNTERTIDASDAETHPSTAEFVDVYLRPLNIKSMLDIPIRHRGKMVGIICCEQKSEIKNWTKDELVFTSSLADLCGRTMNAAERNELQSDLETLNQNLEQLVSQRTKELEKSIDNLTRAQKKLIEQEKLASLGSLVAGVAHEINTPVGVAITGISHISMQLDEIVEATLTGALSKSKLTQFLEDIGTTAKLSLINLERAGGLVADFKLVAANQTSIKAESIDLGAYVEQVANTLKPMTKAAYVSLDMTLERGLIISTAPGLLAQVITNLISNCVTHAFDDTPDPTITLSCRRSENGFEIVCGDNGQGISRDDQQKIFEPFYTTARKKGGTGLGLSIVYNIVTKNLEGEISVKSEPNFGTTFTLLLPEFLRDSLL